MKSSSPTLLHSDPDSGGFYLKKINFTAHPQQRASIFNTGKYLPAKKLLGYKNERKQDKNPQIFLKETA